MKLSPKERAIVRGILDGKHVSQIARDLNVSPEEVLQTFERLLARLRDGMDGHT